MLRRALCASIAALTLVSCNAAESEPAPAPAALESDDDKILYAIGLAMSKQIQHFDFSEREIGLIEKGLNEGSLGKEAAVDLETWGPKIDGFLQTRMAAASDKLATEGLAYVEKQKTEPGAKVLDSGVIVFTQQEGTGAQPSAGATVKVGYRGTFPDGEEFDASAPGSPVTFSLNRVVTCFSEGIQQMKVGGKARLVCPYETAYGERGSPPRIPPKATLVFEVELLEVTEPTAAPAAPGVPETP
jgi:FKBP-type peptidyl-prolyl cis-trans isomerase FkpA